MAEVDVFKKLYDDIALRKGERSAIDVYTGGNGRIDRAVDLILNEDFPRSGTLLDVGGATGNLGYALRDYFQNRHVIDITEECRNSAVLKGNHFWRINVDSQGLAGWRDEEINLITALDFIEHILNPEKFIKECFTTLSQDGKVLINTPNIQYWKHLESLVVNGIFPHTSGDKEVFHGGHIAFYNFFDLKMMFEAAGFVDCKMHTRGLTADPPPPLWASVAKYPDKVQQLSYADLIFSCRKP